VAGHGDLTKLGDAKANGTRLNSEPSSNSKQGEALEWGSARALAGRATGGHAVHHHCIRMVWPWYV
jgi:hypothetical protein